MNNYIDSEFQRLLAANHIGGFSDLANMKLDPVDAPNTDRGGYSEVCFLSLSDTSGAQQNFYIKRQYGHATRSLLHPFGEPTFRRELRNILLYERYNIPALEAVYFAQEKTENGLESILITRALSDYIPLSDCLKDWRAHAESTRLEWMLTVGNLIGRLHARRISHRCCYPKHVFVNLELQPGARFIDLENARFSLMPINSAIADLEAFVRRAEELNDKEIDQLLTSYLAANRLGLTFTGLKKRLLARTAKKMARK